MKWFTPIQHTYIQPMFQLALTGLLAAFLLSGTANADTSVVMKTSKGEIVIDLLDKESPLTVDNFRHYVEEGFYNGTHFHRVISGFMIQGGGFTPDMKKKPTHSPVKNESYNGVSNTRGTIAMARTRDPDSATAQFFINQVDNLSLNALGPKAGYTVFGRVVEGMDVVDDIAKTATTTKSPFRDVPIEPVIIESITIR